MNVTGNVLLATGIRGKSPSADTYEKNYYGHEEWLHSRRFMRHSFIISISG